MGWAVGHDSNWDRDIGYGVPCTCDHPKCKEQIHRGLSYVCGGEPYGGDDGCGLFFCSAHLIVGAKGKERQVCERCAENLMPFDPKPDVRQWIRHKLRDASWATWRSEHPKAVERLQKMMAKR